MRTFQISICVGMLVLGSIQAFIKIVQFSNKGQSHLLSLYNTNKYLQCRNYLSNAVLAHNLPSLAASTYSDDVSSLDLDEFLDDPNIPDGIGEADVRDSYIIPVERSLIEVPTALTSELPVELYYKGRLAFGNYVGKKEGSNGLQVRLASGEIITVDAGQVISCWDILADEDIPSDRQDWSRVTSEAFEILGRIPPKKTDLEEFWRILLQRSSGILADSLDLGIYLFQGRCFKKWADPTLDAEDSEAIALTAAQRYAAALILNNDDFHFKRKSSILQPDAEEVLITEGGYKVLDESTAVFREGEVFAKYFDSVKNQQASNKPDLHTAEGGQFRAGCITRQLRSLEYYATSPPNMPPPSAVKHILKRLSKPPSPQGAMEILREIKRQQRVGQNTDSRVPEPIAESGSRLIGTASSSGGSSITPWSAEVVAATEALSVECAARKQALRESAVLGRPGKMGMRGRMDYRGSSATHPVVCIDSKRASFLDDAFSFSPETGEILVHVADVGSVLRKHPVLQATARERVSSVFSPSGPLHMLPPAALEALKLSTTAPNEVITVAIGVDSTSGHVTSARVFPSIIGPVFAIDVGTADVILGAAGESAEEFGCQQGSELRDPQWYRVDPATVHSVKMYGYPEALLRDLLEVKNLMSAVIARQPWIDSHFNQGPTRDFALDKRTGTYTQSLVEKTIGNRLVNALLTLYSNATAEFCVERNVATPLAWENRDRFDSGYIRRFATQPLRNWLSQLQQKQLRAALRMELPLSRKDCAAAVIHHNSKRQRVSSMEMERRSLMSLESLEAYCAAAGGVSDLSSSNSGSSSSNGGSKGSPGRGVVLIAEGLGLGGAVRLVDFQVNGVVDRNVAKGQRVKVIVKKIVPETKTVQLQIVEE